VISGHDRLAVLMWSVVYTMEPLLLNKCLMKSLVLQNLSLVFDATDSEKHLGYAICQACKIYQACCS